MIDWWTNPYLFLILLLLLFYAHISRTILFIFTHADGSGGVGFSPTCLSVCLSVYLHDIWKTAAVRITEFDTDMFLHKSWNYTYFGIKRSKVKVTRHKKQYRRGSIHSCECRRLVVVYISTIFTSNVARRKPSRAACHWTVLCCVRLANKILSPVR